MTLDPSRRSFLRGTPRSMVKTALQINTPAAYGLNELQTLPDEEFRRIIPRITVSEFSIGKNGDCICQFAGVREELVIADLSHDEQRICQWFIGSQCIEELVERACGELGLEREQAEAATRSAFLKLADHAVCAPLHPL